MAGRSRDGRSWVWTLGMLVLIAVPGFGLGLIAGVAWEEPSLLGSHLLGGTTELVAWPGSAAVPPDEAGEPAALPEVAAPAPRPAAVRPAAEPRDATRMRPETLAPTAAAGRFAVQVGAFGEADSAERLAAKLRGRGFDVYVSPGVAAGQARWRVRVGPSPTREEAERSAARLKAEEQLPTWVLDENGPA
ncbi:MAG: SPOR domain-containing protein [Deltaproteobacteria bacterium]|nr:SPOR domain-containing protein [Deltaproteobacteria bacterium]MBW2360481.1 SPOR domain-containing protein [Deltaproteobacteria bacterium]